MFGCWWLGRLLWSGSDISQIRQFGWWLSHWLIIYKHGIWPIILFKNLTEKEFVKLKQWTTTHTSGLLVEVQLRYYFGSIETSHLNPFSLPYNIKLTTLVTRWRHSRNHRHSILLEVALSPKMAFLFSFINNYFNFIITNLNFQGCTYTITYYILLCILVRESFLGHVPFIL